MTSYHLHAVNYLRNFRIGREPYLHAKIDEWAISRPDSRGSNRMLLDPQVLSNPELKIQADHLRHNLRSSLNRAGRSHRMLSEGHELFAIAKVGPNIWETRSAMDAVVFNDMQKRYANAVRNENKKLESLARGIDGGEEIAAIFTELLNHQRESGEQFMERLNFETQLHNRISEQNLERIRSVVEARDDIMRRLSPPQKRLLGFMPPQNDDDDDDDEEE